ncbi:hypothetical protein LX32DRAFT_654840 [Colletotrichum zoysiae]|uniref:Uncharacterized protein n=1 Tax=Colletotrichum zoysiae TaxID=1216348 RepID=A0AAD9M289_9PEZI|nr:hypothetical protein LX32DRAFT_654840 [Colletotrichum zoysiae]
MSTVEANCDGPLKEIDPGLHKLDTANMDQHEPHVREFIVALAPRGPNDIVFHSQFSSLWNVFHFFTRVISLSSLEPQLIKMKATIILTTLLGAAIASPVAIVNIEATKTEKRDLEPRVVEGIPIDSLLPSVSVLASLNLKLTPMPTATPTRNNTVEILTQILKVILEAVTNLNSDLDGRLGLPDTSAFPNNPVPSLTSGSINLDQLNALLTVITTLVQKATSIGQSLPPDLNPTQLKQIAAIFTVIQQILTALNQTLSKVLTLNGISGANVPSDLLKSLLTSVSGILNNVTSLLGGLLGGGGLLNGVGNLLNDLAKILSSLPVIR